MKMEAINKLCSLSCLAPAGLDIDLDSSDLARVQEWIDVPFTHELRYTLRISRRSAAPDLDQIDYKLLTSTT